LSSHPQVGFLLCAVCRGFFVGEPVPAGAGTHRWLPEGDR